MNKQTKGRMRPINIENKWMDASGERGRGLGKMGEGEWEISRNKSRNKGMAKRI